MLPKKQVMFRKKQVMFRKKQVMLKMILSKFHGVTITLLEKFSSNVDNITKISVTDVVCEDKFINAFLKKKNQCINNETE